MENRPALLCVKVNLTWGWTTLNSRPRTKTVKKLPGSDKTRNEGLRVLLLLVGPRGSWVRPGQGRGVKSHEIIDFCSRMKNVNALLKVFVPTYSLPVILAFETAVVIQ